MTEIKKTLRLEAQLDTSRIRSEVKKLQEELSSGAKIDSSALTDFRKELRNIAKEFASEFKKEIKGVSTSTRVSSSDSQKRREEALAWKQHSTFKRQEELKKKQEDLAYKQRAAEKAREDKRIASEKIREDKRATSQQAREEKQRAKVEATEKANLAKQLNQKRAEWIRDPSRLVASSEEIRSYMQDQKSGRFAQSDMLEQRKLGSDRDKAKALDIVNKENLLRRKLMKEQVKEESSLRDKMAKNFSELVSTGIGRIFGRGAGQFIGEKLGRSMVSQASAAGLAGRALGAAGGAVGGIALAGAAIYGGTRLLQSGLAKGRSERTELANQQFEQAGLVSQGRVLEMSARKTARQELPWYQRAAAGLIGFAKGIPSLTAMRSARSEIAREGRYEGDVAVAESAPLMEATQESFLPNIGTRLRSMEGTNLTSQELNQLQNTGVGAGYGLGETNSRLQQAKGYIGGRALQGAEGNQLFGNMLQMERSIGIGAGEQAQFMEALMGQGQGVTPGKAFTQQKDIIKTAIASGLDASKTSKFLETTSSYVQNNAGLGRMDFSRISDSIAALASSFAADAGRTSVTENDLRRAQQTRELLRQESTSQSGMAGLGNAMAIADAAKGVKGGLSWEQYSVLENVSRDASKDDIQNMLMSTGMTEENASKVATSFARNREKGTFEIAAEKLGLTGGGLAFARERGITSEQMFGMQAGRAGEQTQADRIAQGLAGTEFPTGAIGATEFTTAIQKANVEINTFNTGFGQINKINEQYRVGLLELMKAFEEAKKALEEKEASTRQRPNSSTTGVGDMDSRIPRPLGQPRGY